MCPGCGNPSKGDCFSEHGPFCDDTDCCNSVCSEDPFCCDNSWDGICVNEAFVACAGCGSSSSGSCYQTHGPACNDEECCLTVCNADDFCCIVEWDSICVDEATTMCASCGNPNSGSCFASHATPFCADEACCDYICSIDSFCCDSAWDSICADEATEACTPHCGGPLTDSCFSTHDEPFCNDETCCNSVCALDPFCCDTAWDGLCVDEAFSECGGCGDSSSGSCFEAHSGIGCDNFDCCETICTLDLFCCTVEWDGICASEAASNCAGGGCGSPGCPADLDGSGTVGAADLATLLGAWGTGDPCADLDGSGTVGAADLAILLGAWGPC
jgi:hypothetical protein